MQQRSPKSNGHLFNLATHQIQVHSCSLSFILYYLRGIVYSSHILLYDRPIIIYVSLKTSPLLELGLKLGKEMTNLGPIYSMRLNLDLLHDLSISIHFTI